MSARFTLLTGILEVFLAFAYVVDSFFEFPSPKIYFFVIFLPSWRGLLFFYLFFEGSIRAVAGVADEGLAFFPVWLVRQIVAGVRRARPQPKLLPDEAKPDGGDWLIACEAPRDFGDGDTFEREGALFRLVGRAPGAPPRMHVYRVAPIPDGWIIRRRVRF